MRIQHNIMAMNAYRNLSKNNGALSKNLEKLSSGYRINRAGDDAAGLAISEKMRAQIAGLDQAQKNAQSGINLVQTAEGALTEVHDMLNRMVTLTTQAADGTYGESERAKIQAEIDALTEEIDRIADNSNFNGIKLLDGSLAGGSSSTSAVDADLSKLGVDVTANATDILAVKGKYETNAFGADTTLAVGDKLNLTVNYTDGEGNAKTASVSLYIKKSETNGKVYLDDGTDDGIELTSVKQDGTTAGKIAAADVSKALAEALNENDDFKAAFDVKGDTTQKALTFTAREGGSAGAVVNSVALSQYTKSTDKTVGIATSLDVKTEAADATKAYDLANAKVWNNDKASTATTAEDDLKDAIFEINGEKFVFVNSTLTEKDKAALKDAGVEHWVVLKTANAAVAKDDVKAMAEKISTETGLKVETGKVTANAWTAGTADANITTSVVFKNSEITSSTDGDALTLQIGSEAVETIDVAVESMKAKDLGIAKLSVGNEKLANAAIDTVNAAIEKVSVTRGNLGAVQNRLEHTINNLGVMAENIQDAEANIRDTDIADEMMAYTKNNILIQSAQAMLAQANQVPQGVLQLMQ